jgi:hypothetical protein
MKHVVIAMLCGSLVIAAPPACSTRTPERTHVTSDAREATMTPKTRNYRGKGLSADALASIVRSDDFAGTPALDVNECPVGDEGLRALAASAHTGALRSLWADRVGATDAGARALAQGRFTLTGLYLSFNDLTGAGVEALLASPATGGVEILRLSGNPVGDAGARALAASAASKHLKTLFLGKTGLTDEGLRALAASPHLAALEWLDVTANPLTAEGLAALLDAGRLPALRTLNIDAAAREPAIMERAAKARPELEIHD